MGEKTKGTITISEDNYSELVKINSLFDTITNSLKDAIIVIDKDQTVTFWNEPSESIFGYTEEETINKKLEELILDKKNTDELAKEIDSTTTSSKTIELKAKRKNNKIFPIEIIISKLELNEKTSILLIIKDITCKKASESNFKEAMDLLQAQYKTLLADETLLKEQNESLRNKEEELIAQNEELIEKEQEILESTTKLQTISNTALDAIIMINDEGNITFWNDASTRILGYEKNEIFNQNVHKLIAPERFICEHNKAFELFKKTGKGSAIGKTLELCAIRKDGSEIPVELSLSSIQLNNKWHAVGILRDITSRKKLENALKTERNNLEKTVLKRTEKLNKSLRALEKANKLKDQFLSNMSHELRTPLNAIIGFTDLLEMQYYGTLTEKQDEYLKLIKNSSTHLLDLINDLLDISKIDAGSMELFFKDVQIDEIINETISAFGTQINNKSLEIETIITNEITSIETDKRKLLQILLNLLSNAVKYTPEKGKITIKASKTKSLQLKLSITDTGTGIDENKISNIFSEFYQLNQVRDQALGGTGLGLALSKRLTELLGGKIGVKSEVTKGSTFWVKLPISSG
ncbi:MAG: PAS domain S-box protein [Vampirovibrionia bacterium]